MSALEGQSFVSTSNPKQYIKYLNGKWHAFGIGCTRDNTQEVMLRIRRERVIAKSKEMAIIMGWAK